MKDNVLNFVQFVVRSEEKREKKKLCQTETVVRPW